MDEYIGHIDAEIGKAQEAARLAESSLSRENLLPVEIWGRKKAATLIGVTADVLRDWERNGLLQVPKRKRGQLYREEEIGWLKMISILRNAHYSQMAIRRMLMRLDAGAPDAVAALDTPDMAEDIVSVTDRYLSSLAAARADAAEMRHRLLEMDR